MSKKYDIIYADPPWKYGSRGCRSGRFGKLDYPQMTTPQICALPIEMLAKEDCILFCWFTGSFIEDANRVARAWGFSNLRIDKVWAKKTTGGKPHAVTGPWSMSDAEFILMGTRGKMCSKQVGKRNQYVVTEELYPGKHSKKPDTFRDLITKRFPADFDRLELFARETSPGWDVWGNEVVPDVDLKMCV